jgi:hypothetical protein
MSKGLTGCSFHGEKADAMLDCRALEAFDAMPHGTRGDVDGSIRPIGSLVLDRAQFSGRAGALRFLRQFRMRLFLEHRSCMRFVVRDSLTSITFPHTVQVRSLSSPSTIK